jgi:hypothetical protein
MTPAEFRAALEDSERCVKRMKWIRLNPDLAAYVVIYTSQKYMRVKAGDANPDTLATLVDAAIDEAMETTNARE